MWSRDAEIQERSKAVIWSMMAAGGYSFLAGLISFMGWVLNLPRLTDWDGDGVSIQPNTAVAATAAGAAIILFTLGWRRTVSALAVLTGLIGGLTLLQHALGVNLGIDTLLHFGRTWGSVLTVAPGRMGPPASISFTLIGTGLLLATGGPRARRWVPAVGLLVLAIASLSLAGYFFGASKLHTIPYLTAIAKQTSTILLALGAGLVLLVPEREPIRTLLDRGAGGYMVRRTLPMIVLVPLCLAWMRLQGERADLYDSAFGTALLGLFLTAFLCGLLWWSGADVRQRERLQRQADSALRDGDERLRRRTVQFETLLNAAPIAVYVVDQNFEVCDANPRAIANLGEQMLGQDLRSLLRADWPADVAEELIARLGHTLKTGEPYAAPEIGGRRRNTDDERYFTWQINRIPLPEGGHGVVCYFMDITAQVLARAEIERARDAIKESETKFRTLADASPAVIWFADPQARNVYVNRPFLEYFGKLEEEVMGAQWRPLMHPDDQHAYHTAVSEAIEHQQPMRIRARVQRHDGQWRWVESHGLPRFAEDGTYLGLVGFSPDVTDLVEAQQALRRHQEELERLVEARTGQLRALTVQLTQTEQRERRQLAEFLHDGLQQIIVAAQMHLNLAAKNNGGPDGELGKVGELLKAAVQSSRSLTVELSPPVLYERGLIAALRWLCRHVAEQFQQQVQMQLSDDAEPDDADARALLFLCVRELLFNARKHAAAARVRVTASCGDNGHINVVVQDDGKGFDPAAIGEPATRAGFGLFAIQERLRVLGGELKIDSAPGRGASMVITVPRCNGRAAPAAPPPPMPARTGDAPSRAAGPAFASDRIRVLIADDHAIIRQGLALLMRGQRDLEVVGEASDGQEAVTLTDRLRPNVVVMDVTMPKMSGVDATREIVARYPEIRVVALSMHADPQIAAAMIEAGAVSYLIKERAPEDLIAAIRRVHSEAPQQTVSA